MRNALSPTSDHLAAPSDDLRLLNRLNRQTLKEPRLRRRQRMSIGCIALLCCAACSPHSAPDTSTSTAATASASASAASASDDPYEKLPKVPSLSVSSQTLTDGAPCPEPRCRAPSGFRTVRTSPLSWNGALDPREPRAMSSPCMTLTHRPALGSGTGRARPPSLHHYAAGRCG